MIFIEYCDKYKDVYKKYIMYITKYLYKKIMKSKKSVMIISPLNELEDHLQKDIINKYNQIFLIKISLSTNSKNSVDIIYSKNAKSLVNIIYNNLNNKEVVLSKQEKRDSKINHISHLHVIRIKFGIFIKKEIIAALDCISDNLVSYYSESPYNVIKNERESIKNRIEKNKDLKYYYVQPEDNIWLIAKKFDTTCEKICEVNKLNSRNLNLGQKLLIPGLYKLDNETVIEYMVMPGDTIWLISNKFRIAIKDIRDYNYLNSNVLEKGQMLQLVVNEDNNEIIY